MLVSSTSPVVIHRRSQPADFMQPVVNPHALLFEIMDRLVFPGSVMATDQNGDTNFLIYFIHTNTTKASTATGLPSEIITGLMSISLITSFSIPICPMVIRISASISLSAGSIPRTASRIL